MEDRSNIQNQNIPVIIRDDESCCDTCYFSCCHPSGWYHRFIALIFMCFLGFGSYFCYDNPGALQEHIKKDLNISETQFTMLYSVYSWPNVVLCFIGGFLIDRVFGIRLGTSIYMGVTLLGQVIFAFGAYLNQYWLMIVGRFIFGIGAESLAVGQNNYAVLWFKGKELNMVFGIQMSFVRVGSALGFEVMGYIYDWVHKTVTGPPALGYVLLIAGLTCVLSMFCALFLGFMDKRAERLLRRAESANSEVVRLSDVIYFKPQFWMLTAICVTYYITIFPFISIGEDFFMKRFHMTVADANKINSLVYWIASVLSPVSGILIDKTGKNLIWTLFAIYSTLVAHFLLGFTSINPYIGICIMGFGYSTLASSLWPLVALIIPEYQLGTAYGVCQSIQNLGLAIAAILVGQIIDRWGYVVLEIFFTVSLVLAFLFSLCLWVMDMRLDGNLDLTPTDRRAHHERQAAEVVIDRARLLENEEQPSVEDSGVYVQNNSDTHMRNKYLQRIGAQKLEAHGVIPDTLDEPPPNKVSVNYSGGKVVNLGNELTPTNVKQQPTISWNADKSKLYTLSMVDPDAPSRENPTFREINHWLVINIQGNEISTGQTLTTYVGSGPPKGSGLHRYIFIVFEQQSKITLEPSEFENRRNFSIRTFAKKYSLGKPLAVNFYQAQWDSSVPERR